MKMTEAEVKGESIRRERWTEKVLWMERRMDDMRKLIRDAQAEIDKLNASLEYEYIMTQRILSDLKQDMDGIIDEMVQCAVKRRCTDGSSEEFDF